MLLMLAACTLESGLAAKDGDPTVFDDGDPVTDPDTATDTVPVEECNGEDDDGDGAIDEDFPDADGDGRADCSEATCPPLDEAAAGNVAIDEECAGEEVTVAADPWDIARDTLPVPSGIGPGAGISVGNLTDDDGDGRVGRDDVPDIAFTTSSGHLVVLSGDGSGAGFEVTGMKPFCGAVIADVTGDGAPDVVTADFSGHPIALSGAGDVLWTSPESVTGYPELAVGDLDADGLPEVVVDDLVVNGEDGSFAARLSASYENFRTPAIGDVDQDGDQEVLLGATLSDSDGATLWDVSGGGYNGATALLNADVDEEAEILVTKGAYAALYEADGTLIRYWSISAPYGYAGPPCVADFDGDGAVEVAIPQSDRLSVFELDGTELWSAPTQDLSGAAGCSGYDFDADGAWEVLYADEEDFWIFDGATGAVRYDDPTHSSYTWFEYPLVADVDADGSAEVLVPEQLDDPGVRVYRQADGEWPRSGPAWAVHDFGNTNPDPDGHVPAAPEASWRAWNLFRARPSVDDAARPDLVVSVTDACVADCTYGPVEVAVQVANRGGADAPAGLSLALYAEDLDGPRLVATATLPAVPAGTSLAGQSFELGADAIAAYGYTAVVDDDGTGAGALSECDEADNADTWTDAFCP